MSQDFSNGFSNGHSSVLDQRMAEKGVKPLSADEIDKIQEQLNDSFIYAQDSDVGSHSITAITLTFDPNKLMDGIFSRPIVSLTNEEQIMFVQCKIREYLILTPNTNIKIIVYPEYTQNLDLHFHGVIESSKTGTSNLLRWWKKVFGYFKVSKLNSFERWLTYCTKDQSHMDLPRLGIIKSRRLVVQSTTESHMNTFLRSNLIEDDSDFLSSLSFD